MPNRKTYEDFPCHRECEAAACDHRDAPSDEEWACLGGRVAFIEEPDLH